MILANSDRDPRFGSPTAAPPARNRQVDDEPLRDSPPEELQPCQICCNTDCLLVSHAISGEVTHAVTVTSRMNNVFLCNRETACVMLNGILLFDN